MSKNKNSKKARDSEGQNEPLVMCADYPIISMENNLDERGENVFLIEKTIDEKTTAEKRVGYWLVIDWEIYVVAGVTHWFERSTYTISEGLISKLNGFAT